MYSSKCLQKYSHRNMIYLLGFEILSICISRACEQALVVKKWTCYINGNTSCFAREAKFPRPEWNLGKQPINSCVGFISLLFLFCPVLFFLSCSDIVSVCCFFFLASSSRFQQVVRSNRQPGLTVKLISHQKREIYE